MGTPFAVTAANAFMYYHERDIVETFSLYLTLIDDIFVIWDGPREKLLEFNTEDERIKTTYEISDSKISFLDLLPFNVDGCATLHHSTFQKPLNKYLYYTYRMSHFTPLTTKKLLSNPSLCVMPETALRFTHLVRLVYYSGGVYASEGILLSFYFLFLVKLTIAIGRNG